MSMISETRDGFSSLEQFNNLLFQSLLRPRVICLLDNGSREYKDYIRIMAQFQTTKYHTH